MAPSLRSFAAYALARVWLCQNVSACMRTYTHLHAPHARLHTYGSPHAHLLAYGTHACALTHLREKTFAHAHLHTCAKNFYSCALTHLREKTFTHAHLQTCARKLLRMRTSTLAQENVYACALADLRKKTFTYAREHTFAAIECFEPDLPTPHTRRETDAPSSHHEKLYQY